MTLFKSLVEPLSLKQCHGLINAVTSMVSVAVLTPRRQKPRFSGSTWPQAAPTTGKQCILAQCRLCLLLHIYNMLIMGVSLLCAQGSGMGSKAVTALVANTTLVGSMYSWIGPLVETHEKSICRRTRRVTTIPRPPLKSSRQGESRSTGYIFLWSFFDLLFLKTSENRIPTKIYPAESDSSRRIL